MFLEVLVAGAFLEISPKAGGEVGVMMQALTPAGWARIALLGSLAR